MVSTIEKVVNSEVQGFVYRAEVSGLANFVLRFE